MWFISTERHAKLELTKVNTYGLIFVWKGSDRALKPLLLAAHQGWFVAASISIHLTGVLTDVVPVDSTTIDQWTHPPFSGYFDGMM